MQSRISAIIPVYNEEKHIEEVLRVVTSFPDFYEIIVVDDGSTDATAEVIKKYSVRYLRHHLNRGKGQALETAVKHSTGKILFFCDGDIRGLSHHMIQELLKPVLLKKADMAVALQNTGQYIRRFLLPSFTILSGTRVLRRSIWEKLPDYYKQQFRIETGLNFFARSHSRGIAYVPTLGLHHVIKEKKYGIVEGVRRRWHMIQDITASIIALYT